MKALSTILILLLSVIGFSQSPTIGLIHHTGNESPGYTLFTPSSNYETFLINECGEVVNQWSFNESPGITVYLLENGNLLRAGLDSIQIRDWDNNVVWSVNVSDLGGNQHHDIEPLPNGNILLVMADNYSKAEMLAVGKDSSYSHNQFKLDRIIEIEPIGSYGANVVWEWKIYDHLVQDLYPTLPNYGAIESHPELLDMNYAAESPSDFTHVNAVDYNANLDQIMISARNTNEIYIIDHSTTTQEAAGHTGGNSGKGGDFLFRWGNPETYRPNDPNAIQRLGQQHDCKWIEAGTHKDRISVFNNNGTPPGAGNGSSVHIITPTVMGSNYAMSNNMFEPEDFTWTWSGSVLGNLMEGSSKCGFNILPNDNGLIAETGEGKAIEIDPQGNPVWVYVNPIGNIVFNQYDTPGSNSFFRAERYLPTYPGFDNLTFNNTGIIESENPVSAACLLSSVEENEVEIVIYPNPNSGQFNIQTAEQIQKVEIFDVLGNQVHTSSAKNINLLDAPSGVYFVRILTSNGSGTAQIIVQ